MEIFGTNGDEVGMHEVAELVILYLSMRYNDPLKGVVDKLLFRSNLSDAACERAIKELSKSKNKNADISSLIYGMSRLKAFQRISLRENDWNVTTLMEMESSCRG